MKHINIDDMVSNVIVAEVGGFLGMILGVSILDLELVIKSVLSMLQDQKNKSGFQ